MRQSKDEVLNREAVWLTAWCAVATSSNCHYPDSPGRWADRCLKDFDERFPRQSRSTTDSEGSHD